MELFPAKGIHLVSPFADIFDLDSSVPLFPTSLQQRLLGSLHQAASIRQVMCNTCRNSHYSMLVRMKQIDLLWKRIVILWLYGESNPALHLERVSS